MESASRSSAGACLVGDDPFLGKGHEGHVDDAGETVARAHHALQGDQPGREVHVDLGMQTPDAVGGGEPEGLAGALLHVGDGELGLDLVGTVEGFLRPARAEQVAAQHLVDMEMGIDEGRRDQPAAGVDARRRMAFERRRHRLDAALPRMPMETGCGLVEANSVVDEIRSHSGPASRVGHVSSAVNRPPSGTPPETGRPLFRSTVRRPPAIQGAPIPPRPGLWLTASALQPASGSCQPSGQAMAPSAFFPSK